MKVLIVDDVDYIRKSISKVLTDNDYECEVCENGQTAVEKLQGNHFDLIITDIMMPDMDGFEFLDYIRNQEGAKASTPVLAISGGSKTINSDIALKIIQEKADGILQKPFAKDDLLNALSGLLERRNSAHVHKSATSPETNVSA